MVTTRSAACTQPTTIVAARALRHQRRARTAEEHILGHTHAGQAKPNRRQRPSTSAKAHQPATDQQEQPPQQEQSHGAGQPQPAAAPQDSCSSPASQTTLRPANSNDQPQAVAVDNPQPQPQRRWFGAIGKVSLPNPAAPIFKPAESLIHFAPGVPAIKPESEPPEQTAGNPSERNTFPWFSGLHQRDAACIEQRNDAIRKVGTAVMAHMNGHDVSRSEYVAILDGMLADPETRTRLPPVLVEHYDAAVQGKQATLYNGVLIEKFIHATKRAADVTARIMMTNKNARRERRARRARHRHSPSTFQTPLAPGQPLDPSPPMIPGPVHGERDDCRYSNELGDQVPNTTSPSRALIFSDPLTEANLSRRTQLDQSKGKARETSSLCVDERPGVMRTARGSIRPAPYPRRVSAEARANQSLAAEVAAVYPHFDAVPEESRYSVYSASTGVAHQQPEAPQTADTTIVRMKRLHESNTYESNCVRKAEEAIAAIARAKGPEEAAQVRTGFDLIRCYDVMTAANGDLLSHALLDNMSDSARAQTGPRPQASGSQIMHIDDILPPPAQICLHPQIGPGKLSFVRAFEPADDTGFPHRKIILDTPLRPPPAN